MIGEVVSATLKEAAYAVDWLRSGEQALACVETQIYDLMLLDLGLPGVDGMDVLARIRVRQNPLPVLILTARDAVENRIRGLDLGADDYIVKPFAMGELLARIRAVSRRKGGLPTSVLSNGTLSLDTVTHEATLNGRSLLPTAREFALLQALLARPGAILSRTELEDKIYGWNEEVESNAVEFLIHSLRKKFGPDIIKNVRGVGWMVSKG